MIGVWLAAMVAMAGDVAPWTGTWAIDPERSDDPYRVVTRSIRSPLLSSDAARAMSADGQGGDLEAQHRQTRNTVLSMLATTGQLTFEPSAEGQVRVTFAGHDPVLLTPGARKWVKVRGDDGVLRLRLEVDTHLVLKRREKTITVTESFLPPEEGQAIAVVYVDGSGVYAFEFRRVYRAMGE